MYKPSDDELAAIAWLNSREGLQWSRTRHRQSTYAKRLFSLKDDCDQGLECDCMSQSWDSWGRVNFRGEYENGQRPGWESGSYEIATRLAADTPPVTAAPPPGDYVTLTPEQRLRWQQAIYEDTMQAFQNLGELSASASCTIEELNEFAARFRESTMAALELPAPEAAFQWNVSTPAPPESRSVWDRLMRGYESPPFRAPLRPISFGFQADPSVTVDEAWVGGLTEASGTFEGTFTYDEMVNWQPRWVEQESSDVDGLPAEELGDDPGVTD